MKIQHISDSHGYHNLIQINDSCDMIIFSGDESNYYDKYKNEVEFKFFINWFGNLKNKYKIFIAGNHSSFIFHNKQEVLEICKLLNIIYLEHESIEIEGIKIFGSPYTPTFGNWYFMKSRAKMFELWNDIPEDTDILVVHGPPKGILDLAYEPNGDLKMCGCTSLKSHCLRRLNLKLCLFGHIHSNEDILNAGIVKLSIGDTLYSNGSVVTDGRFGKNMTNGNIFEI